MILAPKNSIIRLSKATVIKPPTPLPDLKDVFSVFLAGSIEMDTAEDWQSKVEKALAETNIVILNPRREDWDSSWTQEIGNKQFRQQVEWELSAQERSSHVAMYFDTETKSPITLLELGLFARYGKMTVCCSDGYWKKGNVDVVCKVYGVDTVNTLDDLVRAIERAYAGYRTP